MKPELNTEEELTKLKAEHSWLSRSSRVQLICLNALVACICLYCCSKVPAFKEVLAGMGEGMPLPVFSTFVFGHIGYLGLFVISLSVMSVISLLYVQRTSLAVTIGILTSMALLLLTIVIAVAVLQPFVVITNGMATN